MKKIVLILLACITIESKATDPSFWIWMTALSLAPTVILSCMPKSIKMFQDYPTIRAVYTGYSIGIAVWALSNYTLTANNNLYQEENQNGTHSYTAQIELLRQTIERLKACNCSCPQS